MTRVDLYVGRCDVYLYGEFHRAMYDCDFRPIKAFEVTDEGGWISRDHHGCDAPTMTVSLDSRYVVSDEHGIINVEVIIGRFFIEDEPRRFIPAHLLLVSAIDGAYGVKIIAGANPFEPSVSARQVLQQEELLFA